MIVFNPEISVIIPTFNSEQSLRVCLDSVFNSRFRNFNFEVIIVDGGSTDNTLLIASQYKTKIVHQTNSTGRSAARDYGIVCARGNILVFLDSDNVIRKNALSVIRNYFNSHSDVDAIVAVIDKNHKNKNFFSLYKNYYMHYKFLMLPQKLNFLQGDLYAIRTSSAQLANSNINSDDTLRGIRMYQSRKNIHLLKQLKVEHLKKYTFAGIIKNDFHIPYQWAIIFLKEQSWKYLHKTQGRFAHASFNQLLSIILAVLTLSAVLLSFFTPPLFYLVALLIGFWLSFNIQFFIFLLKESGINFLMKAIIFTFIDNLIMFVGIVSGTGAYILKRHE